ncbi:ly6/PLAUR domain-containing protein 8 [Lycaon pictus]
MKGILVAVIITAFAVAAVESLSCVQCNSVTNPCENSSVSQCPGNANASCTSLVASFSLDPDHIYQDKACSVDNCLKERDMVETIIVHVSDTEYFHFTSQCCQGKKCNDTSDALAPPLEDSSSNIECPACYGSNESSCSVKSRKCHKEEQCVDLVAEFKNETKKLVLKGCSKISNSTCQFLSAENQTIGGIIFRKFKCVDGFSSSSTAIPNSPPTNPPVSNSSTSSAPNSNKPTSLDSGSRVSFTPAAFGSLLLLRLLL